MRHLLTISMVAIVATAMFSPAQTRAELKTAVVDLQKIFNDYKKTQEGLANLREQESGYQKEYEERMEDYRKLVEQLKGLHDAAQDLSLSEDARTEKNKALEEKVTEARQRERAVREFRSTTKKLSQDQFKRMRDNILEEIRGEIDKFAKGKYSIVLDKSGLTFNGAPTIMYTEGLTDLTDELVKTLNAQ